MLFKQLTIIFIVILSIVCGQSCTSGSAPTGNSPAVKVGDLYQKAMAEFEQGKNKEAIAILDKVLKIDPFNVGSYNLRGFCKRSIGDNKGAIADYSKGLEIAPENFLLYTMRGTSLMQDRAYERAKDDFDKALTIEPGYMFAHSSRATIYMIKGDYQAALNDLELRFASIDFDRSLTYSERGKIFGLMGDFKKAFSNFENALEIAPQQSAIYISRAHAYILLKQYENAIADVKKALEYSDSALIAQILYELGHAYFLNGQNDKALTEYNNSIKKGPANVHSYLWHYLALCKTGKNDVKQLEANARKFSLKPWRKKIVALFCSEITPEQLLKAAVHKSPLAQREQLSEANFFIGEYYLLKGENEKAADFFKKCIVYNCPMHYENKAAIMELDRLQTLEK